MPIDDLWKTFQKGGRAALAAIPPGNEDSLGEFYLATMAFGSHELAVAARHARAAASLAPASRVFAEAAHYLERVVRDGVPKVYVAPDAFLAFIRGGSNLRLYEATSEALRGAYRDGHDLRLVDIGCGDGLALLPALDEHVAFVTLVEPSAAMLATATDRLSERGVAFESHCTTAHAFMDARPDLEADLVQATFSIQSIRREERSALFAWLARRTKRLLIVEFDVPSFPSLHTPEHVRHVVQRYETGLAEYAHPESPVAQGFLMPVLFNYFDSSASRTNYEHPIADWAADLRAAGFGRVATRKLDDYWWAPAVLLDATVAPR